MASTKRPPSDPPGGRRRRPPTVINLEATEVTPPRSESPPPAAEDTAPKQQAAEAAAPQPKPEDVPPEQVAFEPPPPPPEPPRPAEASMPPPASPSWSPMVAGLSSVGGGLVVVLLLWMFGAFSSSQPVSSPQQASSPDLSPRLAAIERQLKELTARPASAVSNPRALNDIAERLARLESAISAPRMPATDPALQGRIAAAEVSAKTAADNVAGLTRRTDTLETALRETNGLIEKLAAVATELQTRMRETGPGADRPSRLAAAAAALRAAVERGEPYAAELAVVKPLTSDSASVAMLEPFAASGLAKEAAFGQELAAIIRPLLNTSAQAPRDSTFLEKLQANAEKLIRIRPIEEARGDDRVAVLTRIAQRAAQGNVPGALAELAKLPPEVRTQASLQAWTAKAEARSKAVEASRKLAADAVTALKATP